MAAIRGRTLTEMGQLFGNPVHLSSLSVVGQPTMVRTWGIPTGPGYRDRPGKWNALIPPFIAIAHLISEWLKNLKA